ncbi:hypothetical protein YB2330_004038 [Saitoella coloradoensis]
MRLRVRVGGDLHSLEVAHVNDETKPTEIDSEHFVGRIFVRIRDFEGVAPEGCQPIRTSEYFNGRSRKFHIQVEGRFKGGPYNGDQVWFGTQFEKMVAIPELAFNAGMKVAKYIDPAVFYEKKAPHPYVMSPYLASVNTLSAWPAPHREDQAVVGHRQSAGLAESDDEYCSSESEEEDLPATPPQPKALSALPAHMLKTDLARPGMSPSFYSFKGFRDDPQYRRVVSPTSTSGSGSSTPITPTEWTGTLGMHQRPEELNQLPPFEFDFESDEEDDTASFFTAREGPEEDPFNEVIVRTSSARARAPSAPAVPEDEEVLGDAVVADDTSINEDVHEHKKHHYHIHPKKSAKKIARKLHLMKPKDPNKEKHKHGSSTPESHTPEETPSHTPRRSLSLKKKDKSEKTSPRNSEDTTRSGQNTPSTVVSPRSSMHLLATTRVTSPLAGQPTEAQVRASNSSISTQSGSSRSLLQIAEQAHQAQVLREDSRKDSGLGRISEDFRKDGDEIPETGVRKAKTEPMGETLGLPGQVEGQGLVTQTSMPLGGVSQWSSEPQIVSGVQNMIVASPEPMPLAPVKERHHHHKHSHEHRHRSSTPKSPPPPDDGLSHKYDVELGPWKFRDPKVEPIEDAGFVGADLHTVKERRKYFAGSVENRKKFVFDSDVVYCMSFFSPHMNFNTFDLKIGPVSINVHKYLQGMPVTYMCRHSDDENLVFWVVEFDLVD